MARCFFFMSMKQMGTFGMLKYGTEFFNNRNKERSMRVPNRRTPVRVRMDVVYA